MLYFFFLIFIVTEIVENDEKYKVMLEKVVETQTSKINSLEETNEYLKKELNFKSAGKNFSFLVKLDNFLILLFRVKCDF